MADFTCPHCTKPIPDAVPKSELEGRVPLSRIAEKETELRKAFAPVEREVGELRAKLKTAEERIGEAGKAGEEILGLRKQLEGAGLALSLARAGVTDPEAADELAMRFERVQPDAEGKRPSAEEWATARLKEAGEGKGSRWLKAYLPEPQTGAAGAAGAAGAGQSSAGSAGTAGAAKAGAKPDGRGVAVDGNRSAAPGGGAPLPKLTRAQIEVEARPLMLERQRLAGRNDAPAVQRRGEIDAALDALGEREQAGA